MSFSASSKFDWLRGCNAGLGYIFECIWFDCALSGFAFFVLIMVADILSKKNKTYQRLLRSEQMDWVLSSANFLLAIVSTVGSLYVLLHNEWFFHSPKDDITMQYPKALNFFIPWMVGYELGRMAHVFVTVLLNPGHPYLSFPDTLPHGLRILLYVLVIEDQIFGMLAVFQMLLESRHLFLSPMNIMKYMTKTDLTAFKVLSIGNQIVEPIIMFFSGPYCALMLYYHWKLIESYGWVSKGAFMFYIGVNTIFSIGDILTIGYYILKYTFDFDISKSNNAIVLWYLKQEEKLKKDKDAERARIAQGYSRVHNDVDANDIEKDPR